MPTSFIALAQAYAPSGVEIAGENLGGGGVIILLVALIIAALTATVARRAKRTG